MSHFNCFGVWGSLAGNAGHKSLGHFGPKSQMTSVAGPPNTYNTSDMQMGVSGCSMGRPSFRSSLPDQAYHAPPPPTTNQYEHTGLDCCGWTLDPRGLWTRRTLVWNCTLVKEGRTWAMAVRAGSYRFLALPNSFDKRNVA